ncbi:MAG: DUF5752 family protein [Thermoleophilia bacterium]|nr:DUF5752 family protein [Thermoleophilia bacterium]
MSEAFSASGSGKVPIGSSARNRGSTRPKSVNGFAVRDCTLLTLSTAVSAENAKEFHGALQLIPESSIYHHFWGRLMRTQFDEPEYSNDFAAWTYHHLRDKALAERLSAVDPAEFDSLGTLRQELIEIVEQALDENPMLSFIRAEQPLHFVQSEIIVLDSGIVYTTPGRWPTACPGSLWAACTITSSTPTGAPATGATTSVSG